MVDAVAKALKRRDNSLTNDFPALPRGILKQFLFQWTDSLKAASIWVTRAVESRLPQTNSDPLTGSYAGRHGHSTATVVVCVVVMARSDRASMEGTEGP